MSLLLFQVDYAICASCFIWSRSTGLEIGNWYKENSCLPDNTGYGFYYDEEKHGIQDPCHTCHGHGYIYRHDGSPPDGLGQEYIEYMRGRNHE